MASSPPQGAGRPAFHLPSRVLHSPPAATGTTTSPGSPSTPSRNAIVKHNHASGFSTPTRRQHHEPGAVEMTELYSPSPSYAQFHTPPQTSAAEFSHAQSLYNSPLIPTRLTSPKPLQLVSSHHVMSPALGQNQGALLPSPMADDDPFNDAKVPIDTPPPTGSAFDISPPISPTDTVASKKAKKPIQPPPLFKPTLGLLFSLSTRQDKLVLLLPALVFSLGSGIIPPLMTFVLGEAFDGFAAYQSAISRPIPDWDSANANLKHDMLIVAIKLIVLGVIAVVLTTIALALWVWHGERVAKRVRYAVYVGVSSKPMAWFDLGMGKRVGPAGDDKESEEEEAENESSGGLMGRFARETDDVRMALSSVIGRIVTCLCTIFACLVVAFWHSYQLTLVILGSAPVIVLVTVIVEVLVSPLMMAERNLNASAASRVERVTGAISTVKAFNAEQTELATFIALAEKSRTIYNKITLLWGFRAGFVQFLLLTMFVTGFWFGNYLVVSGMKSAGDVTIVFWTTLLASSNMQMALPMLNILDKAKVAMAALLETAHEVPDTSGAAAARPDSAVSMMKSVDLDNKHLTHVLGDSSPPSSPTTATLIPIQAEKSRTRRGRGHRRLGSKTPAPVRVMKKMHPSKFTGELALQEVTFHYPSRPAPAAPALDKISLFLPAKDTTYIVGGSGSGKSTVGSLLLGLYKPESGRIEADEQGIDWLDEGWLRGHIGMVSQGASVLFEGTVHENVALGVVGVTGDRKRRPEDVTREEVIRACRAALLHDFVRELPDGYDTMLSGERGASLSGGQRQRLAIARAYIRDPTVLILDEATSALDTVSRQLIHEAIKNWRKNRTTIIITHDLSPITATDFVYVMRDGKVVEQGYRNELEGAEGGWFRHLADIQSTRPEAEQEEANLHEVSEVLGIPDVMVTPPRNAVRPNLMHRLSASPASLLAPNGVNDLGDHIRDIKRIQRLSQNFMEEQEQRRSIHDGSPVPSFVTAQTAAPSPPRPISLAAPSLPYAMPRSNSNQSIKSDFNRRSSYRDSGMSFGALERVGMASSVKRPANGRAVRPISSWHQLKEVVTSDDMTRDESKDEKEAVVAEQEVQPAAPSLVQLFKTIIPMIPSKAGLIFGLFLCVGSGICTPMFSNLFSQMLAGLGAPGSFNLLRTALLLLMIAAIDGFAQWGKYSVLQHVAMGWILKMQKETFTTVLGQEKAWYDQPNNIPVNIVSTLVKDAEDARNIIGYVAGNLFVVISMLLMGLIWAFVSGWQLTLVGLALGPLFVLSTMASTKILDTYERINKAQREECAGRFFQSVSNVKAIRSMSLEPIFLKKFETSLNEAYDGGKKSAFFTGFGTGIAYFVIYVAQAIMFLVGAIFIAKGWYTFQQVLQVFVLLIFSITFSSQVLQNVPQITKAKFATMDLLRMHRLSRETAEAQGKMTFPVQGLITFENVSFNYPTRPDAPVLQNVSFEVKPGECAGIVGPSGSGKSTIATLLQRLYEPNSGVIRIDGRPLPRTDVKYLRDHVAVVSQHPALFDMSVADNIIYGTPDATQADVERAAKAASAHDFIMSLPEGYKTNLGENAGLISGGQAQRLQIARALLRPREILLGDEITSALDAENQEAVMKTIQDVKKGRTTILVTHKVSTMKMCDRLIVVENGRIVQQGTFDNLANRAGGMFASLAGAGEWGA